MAVVGRSVPGIGARRYPYRQTVRQVEAEGTLSCRQCADPPRICKNPSSPLCLQTTELRLLREPRKAAQKGLNGCLHPVAGAERVILAGGCARPKAQGGSLCFGGVMECMVEGEGPAVFTVLTFSPLPAHPLGPGRHQRGLPLPGEWVSLPPQLSELPLS